MKKGLLVLLSAVTLLVGCKKEEETQVVEKPKKPVVVTQVKKEVISDIYSTDGTLVPQEKVNHSLETQGTVEMVVKKNGDFVQAGEVVAKFSDVGAKSAYEMAVANLESAVQNLNTAKINYSKFEALYNKQMISQLEFLNYKDSYTQALGDVSSKKATLADAKSDYEKLTSVAKISGYVGNLDLKDGNIVDKGETIYTIIDDSKMEVTVDFPGKWLNSLVVGSPAEIHVTDLKDRMFKANVKEINPIANSETKKFPVKLSIVNEANDLKDGMYTKVTIPTEKRDSLVVPQESVFIRDLLSYVYKIENGVAKRVEVKTGAIAKPNIEIVSGDLKLNDAVVTEGIFGLSDNDEVTVTTK